MSATPSLEEFTREAEQFLSSRAEPRIVERFEWGRASNNVALFDERSPHEELMKVEAARAWRRLKYDNGFGWISGPTEYELAGRVLGAALQADTGEWGTFAWTQLLLRPRDANRRRHRRDTARHHRRASARPPQRT